MPQMLSVDEALKRINGTGDSRFSAMQMLPAHLPRLSQSGFNTIGVRMSRSQRQSLLELLKH
ncbi:hypothetical protein M1E08_11990 [Erwinia sp. PK3-005]